MFIGLVSVCKLISFSRSLHSNYKELIKCVTLNNQPCKARTEAINSDESLFYPLTVSVTLLMIYMPLLRIWINSRG